ncbi:MAG: phage tail tape measure protein [Acetivibrionales bacterium]|jgi:TP901 family phage tail tape measure protein
MAEKFEVIIGATDKATPILQKFENKLKTTQTTSQKLTTGLSRLGNQAKWAFLGLSGAIAGSVKVFADFETAMAKVATQLPGELMSHFDEMKASVSSLASEFGQSADTMAQGLYDILSAAIEPEHALDLLAVTAKTAAAGFTDVATTTDLFTSYLNAYGKSVDDAAHFSDVLFQSVFRGKMEMKDMTSEMGQIIGIAAQLGVDFENLGAALATITRQGNTTAIATTGIRQAMISFINPGKEAKEAAAALGIEFSAASLKSKGLINSILELKGATEEQLNALFPNIRAFAAVQAIMADAAGAAEDLRLNYEALGTTQEAYDKATNTLAFTLSQLKEAGLSVARTLGESFSPVIKEWAERLTEFAKGFASISDESKNFLSKTLLIVAGVLGFISALGLAVKAINNLFSAFGIAGAVSAPLTLALLAIGLAIAAIWIFFPEISEYFSKWYQGMKENNPFVQKLADAVGNLGESAEKGKNEVAGLVKELETYYALIKRETKEKGYSETGSSVVAAWQTTGLGMLRIIQMTIEGFKQWGEAILDINKMIGDYMWVGLVKAFEGIQWVADTLNKSLEWLAKSAVDLYNDFLKLIHWQWVVDTFTKAWKEVREFFTETKQNLLDTWDAIKQAFGFSPMPDETVEKFRKQTDDLTVSWGNFKEYIEGDDSFIENQRSWWNRFLDILHLRAKEWIADEWEEFKKGMSIAAFVEDVKSLWGDLLKVLHIQQAIDWIKKEWEELKAIFTIENLKTELSELWQEIIDLFHIQQAIEWLDKEWAELCEILSVENLKDTVSKLWKEFVDLFHLGEAYEWLKKEWQELKDIFGEIKVPDGLINIKEAFEKIGAAIKELLDNPIAKFMKWLDGLFVPEELEETKQGFTDIGDESWATLNKLDQFSMEIPNIFATVYDDITQPFADAWDFIKETFSADNAWELGKNFYEYFIGAIKSVRDAVMGITKEEMELLEKEIGVGSGGGSGGTFDTYFDDNKLNSLEKFYDKLGSLGLTGAYAGGAGDVPLGVEKSGTLKTAKDFLNETRDLIRELMGLEPVFQDATLSILSNADAFREVNKTMSDARAGFQPLIDEMNQTTGSAVETSNAIAELSLAFNDLKNIAEQANFDTLMLGLDDSTKKFVQVQKEYKDAINNVYKITQDRMNELIKLEQKHPEMARLIKDQMIALKTDEMNALIALEEKRAAQEEAIRKEEIGVKMEAWQGIKDEYARMNGDSWQVIIRQNNEALQEILNQHEWNRGQIELIEETYNLKLVEGLKGAGEQSVQAMSEASGAIKNKYVQDVMEIIKALGGLGTEGQRVAQELRSSFNAAMASVYSTATAVSSITPGSAPATSGQIIDYLSQHGGFWSTSGGDIFDIPEYQHGGYVPETGLAYLHAGEIVIPPGEKPGPSIGNINITINTNEKIDGRKIWEEIKYQARREGVAFN